jgi:hypothetical protein
MPKYENAVQEGWKAIRESGFPVLVSWEKIKTLGLIKIYQQHGQIAKPAINTVSISTK